MSSSQWMADEGRGTDCPSCGFDIPFDRLLTHLVGCLNVEPGTPIVILIPRASRKPTMDGQLQQLDADIRFEPARYKLVVRDKEFMLTRIENALLTYLVAHRGQVLSRAEIRVAVWTHDPRVQDREVDGYVCRLRRKLAAHPQGRSMISTVRHVGYRFD